MAKDQSNPLAVATGQEPQTLAALLKTDAYANRFKQVLGDRAAQFCSSLISIGNTMQDVEPRSIIGSAMTAACLDLPIDKNLGFAWIVPYRAEGRKVAQFQMGWKGYVQLGLRSGQYAKMNAQAINREVFKGWDAVGEPVLDWEQYDPDKEVWGYFFGYQLVNGFTKTAVWTKEKVIVHAKRYSQSYRSGAKIWTEQFDGMALKTATSNTLRKWGPMSVQMQQAFQSDQAVIRDIDAVPEYVDGNDAESVVEKPVTEHPEQKKQREAAEAAAAAKAKPVKEKAPEPEQKKETATASATTTTEAPSSDEAEEAKMGLAPENVLQMPSPEPEKAPEPTVSAESAQLTENQAKLKKGLEDAGFSFEDFISFASGKFLPKKTDPSCPKQWSDIDDKKSGWFCTSLKGLINGMTVAKSGKKAK